MPSRLELRVVDDPAAACAHSIARRLRLAVRKHGAASLAVSGGSTAPPMFDVLKGLDVPWPNVGVWQVDERVAPDGDASRNATQLDVLPGKHHLMPVTAKDLDAGARRYARALPARFDVVHLGMGDDGHTASWPPGDPVIDSADPVALSQRYQGRVRMTLTPGVVNRATGRVMLTFGAVKARALASWIGASRSDLPVAGLRRSGTVVFTDAATAAEL